MNTSDEIKRLHELRQSGALTQDEFDKAKAQLLNTLPPVNSTADLEQQTRQWAMFIHLSSLMGLIVPLAGMIVPIILWQIKKTELPGIDVHGKIVANWIISSLIYAVICGVLIFVLIGIPLLFALCIVGIVFPIIGGIKASNGEVWNYPLSIQFFK